MIANENFVNAIKKMELAIGSFISAKENLITANRSFVIDIKSFGNDQKTV